MSEKVRIKLNSNKENKAKGFYLLATSGNTYSPAKNEFIVDKKSIELLKNEDVCFEQLPLINEFVKK